MGALVFKKRPKVEDIVYPNVGGLGPMEMIVTEVHEDIAVMSDLQGGTVIASIVEEPDRAETDAEAEDGWDSLGWPNGWI